MSSYRTREKREQTEKFKLIAGIAVFSFIIVGAIIFAVPQLLEDKIEYDKQTGCPIGTNGRIAPVAHTVVLIDETDQLTIHQKEFMETYLRNFVRKDLRVGEFLSIYALGDDVQGSRKPIFEMCKMRDGSDADAFTENEKLMTRQFKKKFEAPLNRKFEDLMTPRSAASQSPIFEMIQAIAVNSFLKHDVEGDRRLIIYSDMLQHTNKYSLYKTMDYENFRRSKYFGEVSFRLPDTEVYLYVFNTQSSYHQNKLIEFWKQFFKEKGAYLNHVESTGR